MRPARPARARTLPGWVRLALALGLVLFFADVPRMALWAAGLEEPACPMDCADEGGPQQHACPPSCAVGPCARAPVVVAAVPLVLPPEAVLAVRSAPPAPAPPAAPAGEGVFQPPRA